MRQPLIFVLVMLVLVAVSDFLEDMPALGFVLQVHSRSSLR